MTRLLYAALLVSALGLSFVVGVAFERERGFARECTHVAPEDFRR
jgi:hypothetical protein